MEEKSIVSSRSLRRAASVVTICEAFVIIRGREIGHVFFFRLVGAFKVVQLPSRDRDSLSSVFIEGMTQQRARRHLRSMRNCSETVRAR